MKHLLLGFLLLISLAACKKDKTQEEDYFKNYTGTFTASRNTKDLILKMGAFFDSTESFAMRVSDVRDDKSVWDQFFLQRIPLKTGKFTLVLSKQWKSLSDSAKRTLASIDYNGSFNQGSDIVQLNYISNDVEPYIIIDQYDAFTKEVKGRIQFAFRMYDPKPGFLDSIVYRSGVFSAKIQTKNEFYDIK